MMSFRTWERHVHNCLNNKNDRFLLYELNLIIPVFIVVNFPVFFYSKGTHWVNEVTNMLIRNKTELDTSSKISTMLEVIPDLSVLDALPSPRLLNTHCSFKYLPKKHIENRCKIIHIIRNPKDVCVSFYYHAKSDPVLDFTGSWDDFFEMWMSDKCKLPAYKIMKRNKCIRAFI